MFLFVRINESRSRGLRTLHIFNATPISPCIFDRVVFFTRRRKRVTRPRVCVLSNSVRFDCSRLGSTLSHGDHDGAIDRSGFREIIITRLKYIWRCEREKRRVLSKKSPFTHGGGDGGGGVAKNTRVYMHKVGRASRFPSPSPSFMRRSLKWLCLSSCPSKSANRCRLVSRNASTERSDV